MFAVVPCVAVLLAQLEPPADRPKAPTPAMLRHAAAPPEPKKPSTLVVPAAVPPRPVTLVAAGGPGGLVIPSVTVVQATHVAALPALQANGPPVGNRIAPAPRPEIAVPDEGRANLMTAPPADLNQPSWKRPALPAAPQPPGPTGGAPLAELANDDFPATVRKNVLAGKLTREVAVTLLVQAAEESDRAGHRDLATRDAEMAVERDPAHRDALRLRAGYRFDSGDYAGALADADAMLALDPADVTVRYARAVTLLHLGRPADAHRALTVLLRDRPGVAEYHRARAEASAGLGDFADADLDSEIAVELAPAEPRHRLLRMKLCVAFGRYDEVVAHFEAGYERNRHAAADPARRQVLAELLDLMVLGRRHDMTGAAAVEVYQWMATTCPDWTRPRELLAGEHLKAGGAELAELHADEALRRDPTAARAYHHRAQARAALGKPGVREDFQTALCLDGSAADTRWELIAVERAAGRRAEARELAEAGVAAHPEAARFRQALADTDLLAGDFAAAERHATYALWLAKEPGEAAAARFTRALALAQGDGADLEASGGRQSPE